MIEVQYVEVNKKETNTGEREREGSELRNRREKMKNERKVKGEPS